MARFQYKGNLTNIRPRQLEFISEILEDRGFIGPEVNIDNVGEAGDNYMSTVKRITVTEDGKTFKMIAKLAPDHELMRVMAQIAIVFKNEQLAYSELLPKFVAIQKSAGVEPVIRYAELYGALLEEPNEVILLEDLNESQFKIQDRFKELSNDSLKLVLKSLAIYHSMSYVLKHQDIEKFNEFKSKFVDIYKGPAWKMEEGKKYFQQLEESTMSMIDDSYKKYVKGNMVDLASVYAKTAKRDGGSKHSVLHQGDVWINNVMFKVKDGVSSECVLIDYQMVRENNPAYDIMYSIFNSTSHEQRIKHFYEFINYYHRELDLSLHNYNLKASLVYPRDQLDCDMKRYGKFVFPICVIVCNAILKKTEDAQKMKAVLDSEKTELTDESMAVIFDVHPETVVMYKQKIEGLIDSFVEFGFL